MPRPAVAFRSEERCETREIPVERELRDVPIPVSVADLALARKRRGERAPAEATEAPAQVEFRLD
jgi:hypothetical protein